VPREEHRVVLVEPAFPARVCPMALDVATLKQVLGDDPKPHDAGSGLVVIYDDERCMLPADTAALRSAEDTRPVGPAIYARRAASGAYTSLNDDDLSALAAGGVLPPTPRSASSISTFHENQALRLTDAQRQRVVATARLVVERVGRQEAVEILSLNGGLLDALLAGALSPASRVLARLAEAAGITLAQILDDRELH